MICYGVRCQYYRRATLRRLFYALVNTLREDKAERLRNEKAIREYLAEQERIAKETLEAELDEADEREFQETEKKKQQYKEELLWKKRNQEAQNALAQKRAIQVH